MFREVCSICLEYCNDCPKTHCNHIFHSNCLTPYMITNNKCPVCRRKLNFSDEVLFTQPDFKLMKTGKKYYSRNYPINQKTLFYFKHYNDFELVGQSQSNGSITIEDTEEGDKFLYFINNYTLF